MPFNSTPPGVVKCHFGPLTLLFFDTFLKLLRLHPRFWIHISHFEVLKRSSRLQCAEVCIASHDVLATLEQAMLKVASTSRSVASLAQKRPRVP